MGHPEHEHCTVYQESEKEEEEAYYHHPLTSVALPQVKRSPDLSQSADADDPDVHAALEGAPLLERGVHRDAGAKDGPGGLQRVALRDLENVNCRVISTNVIHVFEVFGIYQRV